MGMTISKSNRLFMIRDIKTHEKFQAKSGKIGWGSSSAAKCAYAYSENEYFNNQTKYEVYEAKIDDGVKLNKIRSLIHDYYHQSENGEDTLSAIKDIVE